MVSSPLMVGTDIRLLTPIMKELLLNPEAIAINQDFLSTPADPMPACTPTPPAPSPPTPAPAPPPAVCSVALSKQLSKHACSAGQGFGCINGTRSMWVAEGCRGVFTCDGTAGVVCGKDGQLGEHCDCTSGGGGGGGDAHEVWVRKLSTGDYALALPNWGDGAAQVTVCLDAVGWKGQAAHLRNVWNRTNLGPLSGNSFTATVGGGDTLLLKLSASPFSTEV
jgi:hypothetical protein